ncbi:MAG: BNR-4 repeat-containing protein [Saprospiraceae bacterium]
MNKSYLPIFCILLLSYGPAIAQTAPLSRSNQQIDGYRGIWFTLGQFYEYGDKYSGGLGTYTAKHAPLAIYAPAVDKTFFVYGGTTKKKEKHLLCMIGVYDHARQLVSKPTVVYDKMGVDDPHDNPSLLIDKEGFIWVFVSGRGQKRPGFKYRSVAPYSIAAFEQITEEEMTYPQPWYIEGKGFFHFFTKYTGVRELYVETSPDGRAWTEDKKLAGIVAQPGEKSGHYQVSNHWRDKVVTFFSRHPNGNVDQRTDLYYLQTTDFGESWTTADLTPIDLPVTKTDAKALVIDYAGMGKNVYLKDVAFDGEGNPICLYLTSGGHEPGPQNDPREWRVSHWTEGAWRTSVITTSDHNYDMGSLWVADDQWMVVAPTRNEPQLYGGGGEIEMWVSEDNGQTWAKKMAVTQNSRYNANYVRRVVDGRNPFLYFWADGHPGKQSKSQLFFGDSQGHVWRLPYRMRKGWTRAKGGGALGKG